MNPESCYSEGVGLQDATDATSNKLLLLIRNCGSAAYDWGSCCFLANCLVSKHAKRPFLFLMFGFWLIFLCMKMLLHVTIPISVNTLYKRFIVSEINSKWSRRIKKLSPPACLTKFLGHFKFKKICKSTPNDLKRVKKKSPTRRRRPPPTGD